MIHSRKRASVSWQVGEGSSHATIASHSKLGARVRGGGDRTAIERTVELQARIESQEKERIQGAKPQEQVRTNEREREDIREGSGEKKRTSHSREVICAGVIAACNFITSGVRPSRLPGAQEYTC